MGDYGGLATVLKEYKELLQNLSKIDNNLVTKKYIELNSKLDSDDFRDWLKTAEDKRNDKRKTDDSLKTFQKNGKRFTNIFEDFSYNGWTPGNHN